MKNAQHAFVNPFVHIEAMEAVERRFECAKEVDCTPQNNLILEPMEIWIVEIAVGLQRLQLDCRDCSLKRCAGCLTHSGMWTPRGKSR